MLILHITITSVAERLIVWLELLSCTHSVLSWPVSRLLLHLLLDRTG